MDSAAILLLSVKARVDLLIADSLKTYGTTVTISQANRKPTQAQSFHVCHMFLYNYFPNRKPAHCAAHSRTIDWDYLSNPNIIWVGIDDLKSQFLISKDGKPARAQRDGPSLTWVTEPDRTASTRRMKTFLSSHGVASMAAPGVQGCGDPCGCGGNASKHITGQAVDLNGLPLLGANIQTKQPGKYLTSTAAVDAYLSTFHLFRPMAHLAGKARELWHVEAVPVHVANKPLKARTKTHHTHHHGC